jgi:hypothetical protein
VPNLKNITALHGLLERTIAGGNPYRENNYWPEGALLEETLAAYIQAYQTLGYEICDADLLETGYQKIALYIDPRGIPTHAARQLPNGKWTSKLGWLEDIEHELDGLVGDRYGVVGQILKRAATN